ncbi:hypothetical protein P6F34_gp15 [Pseudomonas phage MiCath]|uniref:Uncharacterized protein n=1 Tax=Pseudomonas phage MiCath TaxID=3003729 RepID=A0AAE9VGH9_9CAUD|nr:hypothetical protein P6F34_gp15 [Pseudomonas phage MiCath]WAX22368.1 hypothetical protein [Pseudomonas phage MiCath]
MDQALNQLRKSHRVNSAKLKRAEGILKRVHRAAYVDNPDELHAIWHEVRSYLTANNLIEDDKSESPE